MTLNILNSCLLKLRPRVHKTFQNQDQDQAQVKRSFTMDLFLKPTVIIQRLTVGIYLIEYVLQTRLIGILRICL